MHALIPMRQWMVMLTFAAAVVGSPVIAGHPALAQSANTFGTDQRYCDNSALSKILSTSKGNLLGSAAGGAVGGLVGNQIGKGSGKTVATIVGVLGGALAGGYVGRSMDQTDQGCVGETLEHAPANQPVAWQNPSSGSSYWVTPTRDLRGRRGEPCRNYITDAVVNGAVQRSENTACRQPDGSWVPVSQDYVQAPPAQPAQPAEGAASLSPDTIIKVQQRLRELGFYVRDNIDGKWGPRTAAAVGNFQRSKGLKPTGQLDLETLSALDLPTNASQQ
jgi:surface antigen